MPSVIRRVLPAAVLACLVATAGTALAQFNITGTVTDPTAAAVPLVELRLFTGTGIAIGIPVTTTAANGTYAINGLPSGSYVVEFRPPVATHLLAVQLPVTISGAHTVRNAGLVAGVLLSGYVRDANGVGIAAIDLQARDRSTRELVLTPGDDTDATGFYDVVVPPAEYDLEWRAIAAGSLTWIPVAMRELVEVDAVIDVTMVIGKFVSGRVTSWQGTPQANVNLDFVDQATGVKAVTPGDNTLADGTYTAHVPLGTYTVLVKPAPGTALLAAEAVGVSVAADVTGLDFTLQRGALLSGVVTQPGGLGVEGVKIAAKVTATGAPVPLAYAITDVTGAYQIAVPQGTIDLVFSPPVATGLACRTFAAQYHVIASVLNPVLAFGAVLSGTVTASGLPVPGTDIDVIDPVTGASLPLVGDAVDALGNFTTIVPPGTGHVEIEPPLTAGLVAQRFASLSFAGPLHLPVALSAGVRLTGTLTSAIGTPLAGANVDAHRMSDLVEVFTPGDHTNAAGTYEMILPVGNYRLVFKPGAPYAPADSLTLDNRAVLADTVIDGVMPGASAVGDGLPARGGLSVRAEPNPFNPATVVRFVVPGDGPALVSVHGLDGRRLRTLVAGSLRAGPHEVAWDGRDGDGRALPSGVYLAVVVAGGDASSTKLVLVK